MQRNILVLNPNASEAATRRIQAQAERTANELPGIAILAVTAPFGAATITGAAEGVVAAHAVLVAAAGAIDRCDAIIVAAFNDVGLAALREVAGKPCVGLCESAMLAAAAGGRRFGVVTGGAQLDPALRQLAADYGVADRLVDIVYAATPLAAVAADPDAHRGELEAGIAALARSGAAAVVIGGGPLAGLAARLAAPPGVTLIDGIDAAVRRAAAALDAPVPPAARPGGRYVGLDPDLVRLLGGR